MDKLIEYTLVAGFSEAMIAVLILCCFAPHNKPANQALGWFVFLWALVLLDHLLYRTESYRHLSILAGIFWPISVALGPALYLYASRLLAKRSGWKSLFHYLPFALYYMLLVPFFMQSPSEKTDLLYGSYHPGYAIWQVALMSQVTLLQFIVYTPLIVLKIRRYRQLLKQNYSNIEARDVNWLTAFVLMTVLVFVISVIGSIRREWLDPSQLLMNILVVLSLFFFSLMSLRHKQVSDDLTEQTLDKNSGLNLIDALEKETLISLSKQVTETMHRDKPYLDYDLSLDELAVQVHLDKRLLSQLLNQQFGEKFYDFVNQHRINEATARMQDNPKQSFTQLAVDVGFKSRTTFYNAFKKFTGMTPTEFKQALSTEEQ